MNSEWINVLRRSFIRNIKSNVLFIPLLFFGVFQLIPLMIVVYIGNLYWGILFEFLICLAALYLWRSRVKSSQRIVKKFRFTNTGFQTVKRNGARETVSWGDVEVMSKIGPNTKGKYLYYADYRIKKNSSWFDENLRCENSDEVLILPKKVLKAFYGKWRNHYLQGGKYNWKEDLSKFKRNSKRYLYTCGALLLTSIFVFVIYITADISFMFAIIAAVLGPLGFAGLLLFQIGFRNNRYILKTINEMEEKPLEHFPEDINEYGL